MGAKPRRRPGRRWDGEGRTYEAMLRPLSSRGSVRKVHLRRILKLQGIAFTVLKCAECGWHVHLEAHHRYGSGKPRWKRPGYDGPPKWGACCPKCDCPNWRYVRTEVMDYDAKFGLYSELAR